MRTRPSACATRAAAEGSCRERRRPSRECRRARPPRASRHRARRRRSRPPSAISPTAASDVAIAGRSRNAVSRRSSGTMMIPPPTPNSAAKNPAASPMTTRRTGLFYERGRRPPARAAGRAARARGRSPRRRRHARADRRAARGGTRPRATGEILAGLVGRATASSPASADVPPEDAERVVGVERHPLRGRARPRARAGSGRVGRAARDLRTDVALAARGRASGCRSRSTTGRRPTRPSLGRSLSGSPSVRWPRGCRPAGAEWCSRSDLR